MSSHWTTSQLMNCKSSLRLYPTIRSSSSLFPPYIFNQYILFDSYEDGSRSTLRPSALHFAPRNSSPLMNRWTRSQSPSSSTFSPQPRQILTGCYLYARSRPDTVHWRCGSTKNATSHAAMLDVPSDVIEDPRIQ